MQSRKGHHVVAKLGARRLDHFDREHRLRREVEVKTTLRDLTRRQDLAERRAAVAMLQKEVRPGQRNPPTGIRALLGDGRWNHTQDATDRLVGLSTSCGLGGSVTTTTPDPGNEHPAGGIAMRSRDCPNVGGLMPSSRRCWAVDDDRGPDGRPWRRPHERIQPTSFNPALEGFRLRSYRQLISSSDAKHMEVTAMHPATIRGSRSAWVFVLCVPLSLYAAGLALASRVDSGRTIWTIAGTGTNGFAVRLRRLN